MTRPPTLSESPCQVLWAFGFAGLGARAGEDSPLDRLRHAVEVAEELHELGDQVLDRFVGEARRAGCSWAEIGSVLGVSKQAAQQRFVEQPAVPDIIWPERFTDAARSAIETGAEEARALGHDYLGTEHVLLGLVAESDDVATSALASLGVTETAVREWVRGHVGACDPSNRASLRVMPRMKQALELAWQQAGALGHDRVDCEHLLLAIAHVGGVAGRILADLGVTDERLRDQLGSMLGVDSSRLGAGVRPRRRRLRGRVRASS